MSSLLKIKKKRKKKVKIVIEGQMLNEKSGQMEPVKYTIKVRQ
jgi:hypothetical protein